MKRIPVAIVLLIALLRSCAAVVFSDEMLEPQVPSGYLQKEEHFDPDGFQDYTDYCKYWYADPAPFEEDERWHPVSQEEIEEIRGYFEDFRNWMEMEGRMDEYDFDPDCIGTGDYVRFTDKRSRANYSLYFFDTESGILYYIHNNM